MQDLFWGGLQNPRGVCKSAVGFQCRLQSLLSGADFRRIRKEAACETHTFRFRRSLDTLHFHAGGLLDTFGAFLHSHSFERLSPCFTMLSCELHHRHIVNLKFGRTPGAAQISAMPQMSLWSNGMLPGRIARCLSLMLLFLIVHFVFKLSN